eukprot:8491887-Alexandrium_andersonii.AAC.1
MCIRDSAPGCPCPVVPMFRLRFNIEVLNHSTRGTSPVRGGNLWIRSGSLLKIPASTFRAL